MWRPALSALLLGAYSQTLLGVAPLGFVSLVPWLLTLDDEPKRARALLATWLTTCGFVVLAFPWLVTAANVYAQLPRWAGWLLLVVLAPLLEPQLLVAALVRRRFGPVAAAGAWLLTEHAFPKLLHDTLGHGLQPLPGLRGLAAWGGVPLLTALLLASNELVAHAVRRREHRRWLVAVPLLPLLVGFVPLRQPHEGPELQVAAVQPSLERYDVLLARHGSGGLVEEILSTHEALSGEAARRGAELIIWGESVYPTTFGHPKSEAGAEMDQRIIETVRRAGRPLVFGAYDVDATTEFNAAFLLDAHGVTRDVYRKSRLFPFGEFLPLGEWWARLGLIEGPAGWGRGAGPRVLAVPMANGRTVKVQTLICYEAVFEGIVDAQAELLINLTNDGGFASELQARQHLAVSAFRSVESGLAQVRVANSGTSALIDASGEVVSSLPVGERAVLTGAVPLRRARQLVPLWPFATLMLGFAVVSRARR